MATVSKYTMPDLSNQSTEDLLKAYKILDYALYQKWQYPQRKAAAQYRVHKIGVELQIRGAM